MSKESLSIRFLYGTVPGRLCLKIVTRPWLSIIAGKFLSSPLSRPMIGRFIRKNRIDMSQYPPESYRCFNDFFTRKRANDIGDAPLVSPCDGFLSVYPIDENSTFHIKNVDYSLDHLLQDPHLAHHYRGGTCLIFRLTPQHYHRYGFSCDGAISYCQKIRGKLHCVRPIAYTCRPVFVENSREYVIIDSPACGSVVQMEVGALLVGKISNHPLPTACKGVEKGFFEFGGSTIILLLEKDGPQLSSGLNSPTEKDVRYGQNLIAEY